MERGLGRAAGGLADLIGRHQKTFAAARPGAVKVALLAQS